jgi:hypothetical protein
MANINNPINGIWSRVGLSNQMSFNMTLANASVMVHTSRGMQRPNEETSESIAYYGNTVKSIQSKIGDALEGLSDTIIGAILGLICYDSKSRPRLRLCSICTMTCITAY